MSQLFETPSGIAIPCEDRSEREIKRALHQLDPDLFLTKEVHRPTGAWCYAVYHWRGPAVAPVHILYWTEGEKSDGVPLPLSSGLVYAVESRKQYAGRNLVQEADADNELAKAKMTAEYDAELEEDVTRYFRRRLRLGSAANSRRFFFPGWAGRGRKGAAS